VHIHIYAFPSTISAQEMPGKQVAFSSFGDKPDGAMARGQQRVQQDVTRFPATVLGGPSRLRGNLILCDLQTATSTQFWAQQQNVGVIINCIGERHGSRRAVYPRSQSRPHVLYVDARNVLLLPQAFSTASRIAGRVLEDGQDVLVHCRETFHRAPGIAAGLMQKLCGVDYKVKKVLMLLPRALLKPLRAL
jgi:hypothetical protein